MIKLLRRGTPKCIALISLAIVAIVCLYYVSMGQQYTLKNALKRHAENVDEIVEENILSNENVQHCFLLKESKADITTYEQFGKFNFQPNWMRNREFWDNTFESRFEQQRNDTKRPNLRVIITPFSHNDPGWLKTFTSYFEQNSQQILNNVIDHLLHHSDMTFIWAEMSFLQLWWDRAHPSKQRALQHLIKSGQFEIVTGGWVMTDEANVHIYAMVDQLIEGHQWLRDTLNYTPTTGFSIDPFGHGSTVPYLLAASGFKGTIIQRIHYAWKRYLALYQYGDFYWQPNWQAQNSNGRTILTHNMPFDIYSIKHSCGPHPSICLNFDFRKISGEYTEYSVKAQFIHKNNVQEKADLLLEQYARSASLFPHNVAFVPLGDDFRYNYQIEISQQYENYKAIIDYVNKNPQRYNNTQMSFGLPKHYFQEIERRYKEFPHLKGDFFVYSDIFSEGRPAYWSGYFTTRPLYKMLSRKLEHNLRSAEILFTISLNRAKQHNNLNATRLHEKEYEQIIKARRNLGLFQHHDAITGTSKAAVMRDYGSRLFDSLRDTIRLQEMLIETLFKNAKSNVTHGIVSDFEQTSAYKMPIKTPISLRPNESMDIVLYNSLAQDRLELIVLRTELANVEVRDQFGIKLKIQINPVWQFGELNATQLTASHSLFEVIFVAHLPALTIVKYQIKYVEAMASLATIYCNKCGDKGLFEIKVRRAGDIQLENGQMQLVFDGVSGFMKTITPKMHRKVVQCAIKFSAYRSASYQSGAYLFKPDYEEKTDSDDDVLKKYSENRLIFITSGPIASDVTVIYGNFLAHTVRIFNSGTILDNAIQIDNDIDYEAPPKNRQTETFMRFVTNLDNGQPPIIYTDQNGFQFIRRERIKKLDIEANYYPITTAAFIQDNDFRLSIVTNHAQGAASLEPGYLEVMLDRRTLYDDHRGMGEGVVDSQFTQHHYWLILEQIDGSPTNEQYEMPSQFVNHLSNMLNYPVNVYFVEQSNEFISNNVALFNLRFPCDVHLTTLRTNTANDYPLFPSQLALMVLQRQAATCNIHSSANLCRNTKFKANALHLFTDIHLNSIHNVSLTGLYKFNAITDFNGVHIEPMDIVTFNLEFN